MGIVFFCQSCGARFEVETRMSGKKGRCRKCGQMMAIPRVEEIASMMAIPALAASSVSVGAAAGAASASSWLKDASSSVGLAPLTLDRMPIGMRRGSAPSPLDDAEDSKPYLIAGPELGANKRGGPVSRGANAVGRVWRREVGVVQRAFRWLNETAYFVSLPFLMILLFGIVVKSRHLALFGATFVVLLNIGRVVAGVANLAVVPLREGLNAEKMKKPAWRVAEPLVTISLVVVAFTFIPWLASKPEATGSVTDRLRLGVENLERDIKGEVNRVAEEAKSLDVGGLGDQAREKLKRPGSGLSGGANDAANPPADDRGAATPPRSPEAAVRGLIQGVGERARRTVEEAQSQP